MRPIFSLFLKLAGPGLIFKKISKINLLSKNGRLPELDGIRGMALIFVMLTHMISAEAPLIPVTGKLGVWLFFVLSSFLLSSYFLAAPAKTRDAWEWANYLVQFLLCFELRNVLHES